MVEKSTYVILLFTSLVLMLSFKDLVFIRTDTTEAATKQHQHQHQNEAHLYNEDEGDLGSHHHEEPFDEENKSQDDSSRGGFETSNDDDDFSSHDANFGGGGDGAAQSFEKKIPSLKRMKGTGSVQTLKFKFW